MERINGIKIDIDRMTPQELVEMRKHIGSRIASQIRDMNLVNIALNRSGVYDPVPAFGHPMAAPAGEPEHDPFIDGLNNEPPHAA